MTTVLQYWRARTERRFDAETDLIDLPPDQPRENREPFYVEALQRVQTPEEKRTAVREWASRNPGNSGRRFEEQLAQRLPDAQLVYDGLERNAATNTVVDNYHVRWPAALRPPPA
ncbi:MAG: hypothetical protein HYS81_02900 [Candidatus Aenigmatarchaeota archaeon]|nr:MAG: hypothetical protein HYS81_02900 [Candidatus Aenigmarchaeota archaeon]